MQQLASLNANRVRNDSRIWVGLGLIAVRPQLSIHNGQTTCDQSSRVVSLAPQGSLSPARYWSNYRDVHASSMQKPFC